MAMTASQRSEWGVLGDDVEGVGWLDVREEDEVLDLYDEMTGALDQGQVPFEEAFTIMDDLLEDEIAGGAAESKFARLLAQPVAVGGNGAMVPAVAGRAGVPALAGAAGALAIPGVAGGVAAPAMHGRVMTLVVSQLPDGTVVPRSATPGGVALYSRDMAAAARVKRIGKKVSRLFPKRRSKKKLFKPAGTAFA